jgi:hypothetical protein
MVFLLATVPSEDEGTSSRSPLKSDRRITPCRGLLPTIWQCR